jgi:hypothetical protein
MRLLASLTVYIVVAPLAVLSVLLYAATVHPYDLPARSGSDL